MKKIIVYSTSVCPFCDMAKALLTREGLEFEAVNLDNDHELRMKLSEENNGYRTVPMIFIDEKFIGGYQELQRCIKTDS